MSLIDLEPVRLAAAKAIAEQPNGWNIMTAEQIFAPLPPYPWLIPGIHLAPGRITLLNGYADVGKPVIAMTVSLAVATGRPLWGLFEPTRSGIVLHMNGEIGTYIARERYQRLARGAGVDIEALIASGHLRLANYPAVRLDDSDFEAAMRDACKGCALVVIDSLRAFSGALDENSKDIGVALLMLARVSEATGATILVLHHNRKPKPDEVGGAKMAISGSSSILGGSECAFVMKGEKGGPITVEHERSPIGRPLEDFGLRILDLERDGNPRWGLAVVHLNAEQLDQEVNSAKERNANRGLQEIREGVAGYLAAHAGVHRGSREELRAILGVQRNRFIQAFHSLIQDGTIKQEGTYHAPEFHLQSNPLSGIRTNPYSSVPRTTGDIISIIPPLPLRGRDDMMMDTDRVRMPPGGSEGRD